MTQERMHPDDLRAIMSSQLALGLGDGLTIEDVARGIEGADAILAELARTAKPEATEEWPKEALDRIEEWAESCERQMDRAEKAESRVKEMEAKEGLISDEVLDQLQSARDRIHDLEDAIKKHRSIVKGSHHWRGCDWDEDLLAKVTL